jgi:hypothetical protein
MYACNKNAWNKIECFSAASLSFLVKCLWVRPGAYQRVEHLENASLRYAPALLANIRLGWKGLAGINTLVFTDIYKLQP